MKLVQYSVGPISKAPEQLFYCKIRTFTAKLYFSLGMLS